MSTENQTGGGPQESTLELENAIETYRTIAEWIRFADAKAGVTLTVNGVMLGLLIPTLKSYLSDKAIEHPFEGWTALVVSLFVVWLIFVTLSAVNSFLCILPIRGVGKQLALTQATHFHPAAISMRYALNDSEKFLSNCEQAGSAGLKREVHAAILIDSHLSNSKYRYVARSIWGLAASVIFGFLYLMAIQF